MSTAGVRIALAAKRAIGLRGSKEFLFAFYHAKTCAIDPIQFITGCTLGNSNIIINDKKKHTLELVRQSDGTGVRVSLKEDVLKKMRKCMKLKKDSEKLKTKKARQKAQREYKDDLEDVMHLLQHEDDKALVDTAPFTINLKPYLKF